MPRKKNLQLSQSDKALKILKMVIDEPGRRFTQQELSKILDCSVQTIPRLFDSIESVFGPIIERGTDGRRHWFALRYQQGDLVLDDEAPSVKKMRFVLSASRDDTLLRDRLRILSHLDRLSLEEHLSRDPGRLNMVLSLRYPFLWRDSGDAALSGSQNVSKAAYAIHNRKGMALEVRKPFSRESGEISVMPLKLAFVRGSFWIIGDSPVKDAAPKRVAFCAADTANSRITGLKLPGVWDEETGEPVKPAALADLGLGLTEEPCEFRFKILDPLLLRSVAEHPLSKEQKLSADYAWRNTVAGYVSIKVQDPKAALRWMWIVRDRISDISQKGDPISNELLERLVKPELEARLAPDELS